MTPKNKNRNRKKKSGTQMNALVLQNLGEKNV